MRRRKHNCKQKHYYRSIQTLSNATVSQQESKHFVHCTCSSASQYSQGLLWLRLSLCSLRFPGNTRPRCARVSSDMYLLPVLIGSMC